MNWWTRAKNIYFLSGITPQDIQENPHSFALHHANKAEMKGKGYIVGLSEEESSFAQTLNADGKDTKI